MRSGWIGFGLTLMAAEALAAPQTVVSPATRVSLMELYTSEGCDSCPPAEEWLAGLTDDDRLWKQLVPVAFHVDYWDELGWKDRFDSHAYTLRQQRISAHAGNLTLYTPEFVLDGGEWRNWFNHRPLDLSDSSKAGVLSLVVEGQHRIHVGFVPAMAVGQSLDVNVVLLAFGVKTRPDAGENQGAVLRHDFLVVSSAQGGLRFNKDGYDGEVVLPQPVPVEAARYALAGWVSRPGDPTPLQAAGGWLKAQP